MAHTKSGGSTDVNRNSRGKRLGVKLYGGQKTTVGKIIIRQKGTKYHPGKNVRLGRDFTIYAMTSGTVLFKTVQGKMVVDVI